jgi:N utilization substance protein A
MAREEDNTAEVIVPDRQLSLAIGKEGQNARLAAKLTGWRIDIKSQTAYEEELAAKGMTFEEWQAQAREEAAQRAAAIALKAEEERKAAAAAAAAARALTPEQEIALQYAGEPEQEPQPVAAEATPEPAAATAAPAAPGAPGKPVIRFAEELVRPPLEEAARPGGGQKRRGGPPGRRDDDEVRAAQQKKKKGGARRILPEDDEDDIGEEIDFDLGEFEDAIS